jgi:hypothetical protein
MSALENSFSSFNSRQIKRLRVYRAAVSSGFYNEGPFADSPKFRQVHIFPETPPNAEQVQAQFESAKTLQPDTQDITLPNNGSGSKDGSDVGDHDRPWEFGSLPNGSAPGLFKTREYVRLLLLRSRLNAVEDLTSRPIARVFQPDDFSLNWKSPVTSPTLQVV